MIDEDTGTEKRKEEGEGGEWNLGTRDMVGFLGGGGEGTAAGGDEGSSRVEDVSRIWNGALDALVRVRESGGEVRRRAEKARDAVGYLDGS